MTKKAKGICCAAVLGLVLVNVPGAEASKPSKQALTLASVLQNPQATPAQKQQACVGLMALGAGAAPAVPALDQMLKDPNPQMRGDAVAVLMKIGPGAHAAEPDLKAMATSDPNPQVRSLAGDAVIQVSKQSGGGLLSSLFGNKGKAQAGNTSGGPGGLLGNALGTASSLPIGGKAGNILNQVQQVSGAVLPGGSTTQPDATANGGMPTVANGQTPAGILPQVGDGSTTPGMAPGTMQPGTMQPIAMQPGTMQPIAMQPGTMQPIAMQPGATYNPQFANGAVGQQPPSNQIAYVPQTTGAPVTGATYQPVGGGAPVVATGYAPASNALTSGQARSSVLSRPGELDNYTFAANGGDTISLSVAASSTTSTYHPDYKVVAPDGTVVMQNGSGNVAAIGDSYRVPATAAGSYSVVVWDANLSNSGGAYTVQIDGATGGPSTAQPAAAPGYVASNVPQNSVAQPAYNPLGAQPVQQQVPQGGQTTVVMVPQQGGAYGSVPQAQPQLINGAGQPVAYAPTYPTQQTGGFVPQQQQQSGTFVQQQPQAGFAQAAPVQDETIVIVTPAQPAYGQQPGAPMDITPQSNVVLANYTQPLIPQAVAMPAPQSGPAAGGNADYPGLGGGAAVRQLLVHQVAVQDNRVRTNQAFTLLVPDQWHGQANTAWTDANPASPAEPEFELTNQQGTSLIGTQPAMFYYWSNDPNFAKSAARQQSHAGAQVMAPPANCQDALARIAWPVRRSAQDAQVTSFKRIKEYAGVYATELPQLQGLKETLDGGVIRVHYSQNGAAYDEDLYGVLGVITNTQTGASNWVIDRMVDFKAPAGQLDALEKQMDFVYGSARPTVRWFGNYLKTQQYLVAKLNATDPNSIGQPQYGSDQMAAEPLNPQQAALMQRYQSGYDRSLLAIDRPIGGTEYFRNADGSYVPLPSGYGFAFTDGNGNYLVASTNAPMFPNINGTQAQWQPMSPIAFK